MKKCSGLGESHGDMNWEGLGFSLTPTDYMHVMKCSKGGKFSQGSIVRYGNIEISPAAGILNYGQVKLLHIFCLLKCPFKMVLNCSCCCHVNFYNVENCAIALVAETSKLLLRTSI